MELLTPLETLCRLILRAKELDAQIPGDDAEEETADDVDDLGDDDEENDGGALSVLEDDMNTGVEEEVVAVLDDLGEDQLAEVVALAWVGRGTYDASEWEDAFGEANDLDPEERIDELLEMPALGGHLEAGLAAFDYSCDGVGQID